MLKNPLALWVVVCVQVIADVQYLEPVARKALVEIREAMWQTITGVRTQV